ncbi:type III-B CRISPR module RAMP protein Cmr4 [Thermomonospora cellulosilytica]|uniref:CRISPR-associated protein Cmr4 n=1 Tax=Thermomonospora cellulosilytica TaxID=1411118 RepID=A0A7W3RBR0_9ACTN|nr:type III-B CRISPR module RAMP protein Cmr4 [Thermomonospora cellulosilytica]MBA9007292.1 CRISPR-associated protein Cmr4 [Thermomonospora cellulosilytica]
MTRQSRSGPRRSRELLLYLYAESPVHAGASDSLDVLDLPVQREATTGYPVIWGQSLKGALRQAAGDAGWDERLLTWVFGSEPGQAGDEGTWPGALAVGDAQLVAMPVPTLRHTFAWVTSDLALGRLARRFHAAGRSVPQPTSVAADGAAAADAKWTDHQGGSGEVLGPCVVGLGTAPDEALAAWARRLAAECLPGADGRAPDGPAPQPSEGADGRSAGDAAPDARASDPFRPFRDKLATDLILVGASIMPTLLTECTEQTARVQLTDVKTVQHGPFYSEYLPAETILAAALTLRELPPPRAKAGAPPTEDDWYGTALTHMTDLLDSRLIQIGGDETLGKGLVWCRLLGAR